MSGCPGPVVGLNERGKPIAPVDQLVGAIDELLRKAKRGPCISYMRGPRSRCATYVIRRSPVRAPRAIHRDLSLRYASQSTAAAAAYSADAAANSATARGPTQMDARINPAPLAKYMAHSPTRRRILEIGRNRVRLAGARWPRRGPRSAPIGPAAWPDTAPPTGKSAPAGRPADAVAARQTVDEPVDNLPICGQVGPCGGQAGGYLKNLEISG